MSDNILKTLKNHRQKCKQMTVEILTVTGCSSAQPTKDKVVALLAEHGLRDVNIRETVITTQEQAARKKFPGSPTVRVNGVDVESSDGEFSDYGMG